MGVLPEQSLHRIFGGIHRDKGEMILKNVILIPTSATALGSQRRKEQR